METKQIIVMRKDLNMRKGKMCAQASHASLGAFLCFAGYIEERGGRDYKLFVEKESPLYHWLTNSFTKVCVGVPDEKTLHKIYNKAMNMSLPRKLIKDAGRTEFKEPTYTCCAIGPWWADEIDEITGDLKLL